MTANTSMVVRPSSTVTGLASTAAVDVDDEVPDPGDIVPVRVQIVDATGNGVAVSGAVVALAIAGDAVATLADSSVTTDTNGRGLTSLTVDSGAAAGSRFYVYVSSVTFP